jgi:UDP-glucose 4-epimerase
LNEKIVLITGGAGFIGSHLVDHFLAEGRRVVVLDNLSSGAISNLPEHKNLTFVKGDVRDPVAVESLVKDCDIIFHLAEYIPSTKSYGSGHVVKYSMNEPLQDFDVSLRGTLTILDYAKKYAKKLIFTSTAAVYGNTKTAMEETQIPEPTSPYGLSKLCAEKYIQLYNRIYGLPIVIVRFFNVYGPRQTKYLMYDLLLKLSKNPEALEMLGTGNETRDFVFIKDVIRALALVSAEKSAEGQIYNVSSGKPIAIKEVVSTMLKLAGVKIDVTFTGSSWKGDIQNLEGNATKLFSLGFKPDYSLSSGLELLIYWFNTQRKVLE